VRIGELGAAAATTAKTIRFYEHAGLLPAPPRTSRLPPA
jgi:DNA-binding transcriptional MerR regulator